ncbi:MAG TPA: choice-of-anchor P family protein [Ktedonobacterales bacterium]|nr:choice-of-anchor P family protein [Ktedonobacterales bacterium]
MTIFRSLRNHLLLCLVLLLGLSSLVITNATQAAAAPSIPAATALGTLNGSAYGGYLQTQAGSGVESVGPLFPVGLSCVLSSQTATASGSLAALGSFLSSGAANDTVTTSELGTSASVQSSATVQGLSLLGGAITATAVQSVANSMATTTTATSTNGSTFTSLVIGGTPITATPAPNTKITLAGIGTVTVNEQVGPVNSVNATSITVIALDVSVTLSNSFGLPIGTHILIAYANSGFSRNVPPATISSYAWGLYATGLGGAASGPFTAVGVSCTGGNSTNSLTSVSVPPLISTGTMVDQAFGSVNTGGSTVTGKSTIQTANITGLLHADSITVSGTASFTPSLHGYTGYTLSLTNASLLGGTIPIAASPAPNTVITIPGVGVAVVNEQSSSGGAAGAKININAIDIMVNVANTLGLPVGARIIIGHANASVTPTA